MSAIGRVSCLVPRTQHSAELLPRDAPLIRAPAEREAQVPALRRSAKRRCTASGTRDPYDLKKLSAACFEARFLAAAACNRSISEVISAIRSVSSSTESSERSCPISWVIFFLGLLSSSSMAMRPAPCSKAAHRLPATTPLANQMPRLFGKPVPTFPDHALSFGQGQIMEKVPSQMTVIGISKPGGPEVLLPETRNVPAPGPN